MSLVDGLCTPQGTWLAYARRYLLCDRQRIAERCYRGSAGRHRSGPPAADLSHPFKITARYLIALRGHGIGRRLLQMDADVRDWLGPGVSSREARASLRTVGAFRVSGRDVGCSSGTVGRRFLVDPTHGQIWLGHAKDRAPGEQGRRGEPGARGSSAPPRRDAVSRPWPTERPRARYVTPCATSTTGAGSCAACSPPPTSPGSSPPRCSPSCCSATAGRSSSACWRRSRCCWRRCRCGCSARPPSASTAATRSAPTTPRRTIWCGSSCS